MYFHTAGILRKNDESMNVVYFEWVSVTNFQCPCTLPDFFLCVYFQTLQVDIHDTRFAEKQGEDFLTYGMVKDCSAVKSASCLRPKGSINLIGTGFKISQSIWLSWGYKSEIQQFSRNTNNTEVTFACAGYCGNCGLKAGLLLLEVIGQQGN